VNATTIESTSLVMYDYIFIYIHEQSDIVRSMYRDATNICVVSALEYNLI